MSSTCAHHYPHTKFHQCSPYRILDIVFFFFFFFLLLANQNRYANEVSNMCIWWWQTTWVVVVPPHYQHTKFVIKLDSLSPIHRFIGQAMSWGKYWARRYVEPNIFPTHGETNKFVYWMKNKIQFYHYYVLRILCPISLYTFLNKQISNEREKKN